MNMLRTSLTMGTILLFFSSPLLAAKASIYFSPAISYLNAQTSGEPLSASRGLTPKFALGVDWTSRPIGGFYLGGEAIAMPFKPLLINSQGVQIRPTYVYGINLLTGVSFDYYVKGYLRLGAVVSSFKTFLRSRTGYQIGGGLEWSLNQTWSLRGDYVRTRYRTLPDVGSTPIGSIKMDELSAGFVIRFC